MFRGSDRGDIVSKISRPGFSYRGKPAYAGLGSPPLGGGDWLRNSEYHFWVKLIFFK